MNGPDPLRFGSLEVMLNDTGLYPLVEWVVFRSFSEAGMYIRVFPNFVYKFGEFIDFVDFAESFVYI